MQRPLLSCLLAAAVGIAGTLAGAVLPATAAPAAPTISTPPDGAQAPTNPVMHWSAVSGAIKYQVQISASSDFSTLNFNATTGNVYATPPSDLAVGTYWWRVRSLDATGAASAYRTSTFDKLAADAPAVKTPLDGQELKYPSQPLILAWDPLPGAKSYEVQIDDDAAFVGAPNPVGTVNNSYTPANPPFGTTYYWRVRGKSAQGVPTQYSEPRAYSMVWQDSTGATEPSVEGAKPNLLSPPNTTSSTIEEIRLDWAPLRGASAYELQISPDQFFNAPIGGTRVVNSTAFSPSPSLPAGSYYWRVRGLNTSKPAEPSPWSDPWVFTRAWPASNATTRPRGTGDNRHAQVKLLLPQDGHYASSNTPLAEPVFSWEPQREASHYELQVGTDANFSPNTYSICETNHTVVSPYNRVKGGTPCTLPRVVPTQVLYWRVRAIDAPASSPEVFGVFSEVRSFLYDPKFVNQTAPASGQLVDVPILKWDPVDNISRYKVTISPTSALEGCSTLTAETYNTTYVPESLSDTCTGSMSWTVQSMEDDGQLSRLRNFAAWPTFTISPPGRGATLGPVTMETTDSVRPPLVRWASLVNAATYRVHFSVSGANSFSPANKETNQPAFTYTGKNTTWSEVLTPGKYDFYVQAFDKDGASLATTGLYTFTIGAWPSATLVSPAKCLPTDTEPCALHDTPTLDWQPLKNIGLYHVYLATDPNFTNITKDWITTFSEVTPAESLPDSQAGEAYYWYVRPCYTLTACAPFDTSVFPKAGAFRKESAPVEALSPKRVDTTIPVVEDEVTFAWTDYLTTNEAFNGQIPVGSTVPEVVTQEAQSYQVQVSTTAEFTNIIETTTHPIDQTSYTAQSKTYPDGPLFWRVRAFDQSGNPLTYSCAPNVTRTQPACSDFQFQKKSPAPTQKLPAAGASVTSSPTLQWDPMAYAATYQVEVYSNPDSALSSTNRVVSLTTRSTAAIGTSSLAKGNYGWRVRRVDINGVAGAWTAESNAGVRRFKVAGPVPTLVAPADGAKLAGNSVLLRWQPVAGATRYKVEVSKDNFATIFETVTTDMTSWAPGLLSPKWWAGAYAWRVTTLDSSGKVLATSAKRSLSILTVPGAPTSPRATAGNSSALVTWTAPTDKGGSTITKYTVTSNPGGKIATTSGSTTVTVTGLTNGTSYTFTITATNATGTSAPSRPSNRVTPYGTVERWAGADRFASSAVFSSKSYPAGVNVAYVANGQNFPDALSGAPIAGMTGGPVLLTNVSSLPRPIASELQRLKPKKIVVLGGTGAVSNTVKTKLDAYTTGPVERWAGSDRFASSAAFSAKSFASGVSVAYVANGQNFPDALSGAPIAGKTPGPVLLTNASSLPGPIATELKRLQPKKIVVLGGTGAVSNAVKAKLDAYTTGPVERWAGSDRFASSATFSAKSYAVGVGVVYIANGQNFPDALSGAPIAGKTKGPVLLTNVGSLPGPIATELKRLKPKKIVVLGGTGAVSSTVERQLKSYLG